MLEVLAVRPQVEPVRAEDLACGSVRVIDRDRIAGLEAGDRHPLDLASFVDPRNHRMCEPDPRACPGVLDQPTEQVGPGLHDLHELLTLAADILLVSVRRALLAVPALRPLTAACADVQSCRVHDLDDTTAGRVVVRTAPIAPNASASELCYLCFGPAARPEASKPRLPCAIHESLPQHTLLRANIRSIGLHVLLSRLEPPCKQPMWIRRKPNESALVLRSALVTVEAETLHAVEPCLCGLRTRNDVGQTLGLNEAEPAP